MLARTNEPTNTETALASPVAGRARDDAFGLAERHSRRVRVLKLAVPLVATIIAVAFPVYSYLAAPASIAVQSDGSAVADGKLVMANPKLNGFTQQKLPYSMTAMRAIQDVAKQGIIELEGINAKLPITADNTAAINASNGTYNRDGNTLSLNSDVSVSTTDGVVAKLKSVYLDMGKGIMRTDDPVEISRGGSRITADSMSVEGNGKVLVFENRVRVTIDPASLKAAEEKSGEPNAAQ
jgi:lipopolysaccharide export system protein LptC